MIGVLALFAWMQRPFVVHGPSMSPTLQEGDWLFVDRDAKIQFGDWVVFREPDIGGAVVKRVCALPGETVQLIDGKLYVDGRVKEMAPSNVREQIAMFEATGESAIQEFRDFRLFSIDGFLKDGLFVESLHPAMGLGLEVGFSLPENESSVTLEVRAGEDIFQLRFDNNQSLLTLVRVAPGESVLLNESPWPTALRNGRAFLSLQGQMIHAYWNDDLLFEALPFPPSPQRVLADAPIEFGRSGQPRIHHTAGAMIDSVRVGRSISRISRGAFGCASPLSLRAGEYYLLGDQPSKSRDSRQYGAVHLDQMVGVVRGRLFADNRNEWGWQ